MSTCLYKMAARKLTTNVQSDNSRNSSRSTDLRSYLGDYFPIRRRTGFISYGAWLKSYKAEQLRRFNTVLRAKIQSSDEIKAKLKQHSQYKSRKGCPKPSFLLDGFYILNHCNAKDPEEVFSLNVKSQGLNLAITDDFHLFTNLEFIDAEDNFLKVEIFSSFYRLIQLKLPLNKVTNLNITLGEFPHLQHLDLSYNNLTGDCFLSLGLMPNLRFLNLGNNNISFLPIESTKCFSLSDSMKVRYLRFPRLEVLKLDNNKLESPDIFIPLARMSQLIYLDLEGNSLYHIPRIEKGNRESKIITLSSIFPAVKQTKLPVLKEEKHIDNKVNGNKGNKEKDVEKLTIHDEETGGHDEETGGHGEERGGQKPGNKTDETLQDKNLKCKDLDEGIPDDKILVDKIPDDKILVDKISKDNTENQYHEGLSDSGEGLPDSMEGLPGSREGLLGSRAESYGSREESYGSREGLLGSREESYGSKEGLISSREISHSRKEGFVSSRERSHSNREGIASSKSRSHSSREGFDRSRERSRSSKETSFSSRETSLSSRETSQSMKEISSSKERLRSSRDKLCSRKNGSRSCQKETHRYMENLHSIREGFHGSREILHVCGESLSNEEHCNDYLNENVGLTASDSVFLNEFDSEESLLAHHISDEMLLFEDIPSIEDLDLFANLTKLKEASEQMVHTCEPQPPSLTLSLPLPGDSELPETEQEIKETSSSMEIDGRPILQPDYHVDSELDLELCSATYSEESSKVEIVESEASTIPMKTNTCDCYSTRPVKETDSELLPFPQLTILNIANNNVFCEEALMAIEDWPMIQQLFMFGNPIIEYNRQRRISIQTADLCNKLQVDIYHKPVKHLNEHHLEIQLSNKRKIKSHIRKVPKIPVEKLMAIESVQFPDQISSQLLGKNVSMKENTVVELKKVDLHNIGTPTEEKEYLVPTNVLDKRDLPNSDNIFYQEKSPFFVTQLKDDYIDLTEMFTDEEVLNAEKELEKEAQSFYHNDYSSNNPMKAKFKGYEMLFDENSLNARNSFSNDKLSNINELREALKPNLPLRRRIPKNYTQDLVLKSKTTTSTTTCKFEQHIDKILKTIKDEPIMHEIGLEEIFNNPSSYIEEYKQAQYLIKQIEHYYKNTLFNRRQQPSSVNRNKKT